MSAVNGSGQTVTAPLDVESLVERCVGNRSFAEKILSRFESRFDGDLQILVDRQTQQDWVEIGNIAHRLKGSAASVSAPGIADACGELEDLARGERFEEIAVCMDRLRREWRRFSEFSASLPRPFAGE